MAGNEQSRKGTVMNLHETSLPASALSNSFKKKEREDSRLEINKDGVMLLENSQNQRLAYSDEPQQSERLILEKLKRAYIKTQFTLNHWVTETQNFSTHHKQK